MRTFHLAFAGSLALLLSLGCSGAKEAAKEAEPEVAPVLVEVASVTRQDIRDMVWVDGTFAVPEGRQVKLAPTLAGKLTRVLVKEGDTVAAGQLVAQVDTGVQSALQKSAFAAAAAAAAQSSQSEMSYQAAAADQKSAVEAASLALEEAQAERRANVTQAESELTLLRAGARRQEVTQAEQSVLQATVNLKQAKLDAERDASLLKKGFISGQKADASQAAFEVAQAALTQAQAQLEIVKLGARPEELKVAEQKLAAAKEVGDKKIAQAQSALRQAKNGTMAVAAKAQEASAAKLTASQRQAELASASFTVQNGEIRSPIAGRVIQRLLAPGDQADSTTPVLEIAAIGATIDFVGSVEATQANRLQPGLAAVFPDHSDITGALTSVGTANGQTGMVPIRLSCRQPGQMIPGTFASAQIIVGVQRRALAVPVAAVLTREGKSVVFVVKDGAAHLTEVTLGARDGDLVAIQKGIGSDAKVVLIGQHELADGAKVETAGDKK